MCKNKAYWVSENQLTKGVVFDRMLKPMAIMLFTFNSHSINRHNLRLRCQWYQASH